MVDLSTFDGSTGCIDIVAGSEFETTAADGDKVTFKVTGTQCFKKADGSKADNPVDFCGAGEIETSVVDLDYDIDGGTGRFKDAEGSGTIHSLVDHCGPSGDTFTAQTNGTIEYQASKRNGK